MNDTTLETLLDFEAIRSLKARYMRLVDTKGWAELKDVLATDVRAHYGADKYAFEGQDDVLAFLERSLGVPGCTSVHHACQPELSRQEDGTIRGTWALRDTVIYLAHDIQIQGAAIYHDVYRKIDDRWVIAETRYERLYEERFSRSELKSLHLVHNRFPLPTNEV